jgi:hypothetical protein
MRSGCCLVPNWQWISETLTGGRSCGAFLDQGEVRQANGRN